MAKKRNGRQDAIRDIVRNKDVRTQRVLVDELRAMGFDCTQATVSRDIADMGLRKLPEGIYVLAEDLHLQRMVSELVTGVLRTDNLVKRYGNRTVANHVSINVRQGEIVGLLGPNGAGKTTTFYMTTGLVTPNEGRVFLNNIDITRLPVYKRA